MFGKSDEVMHNTKLRAWSPNAISMSKPLTTANFDAFVETYPQNHAELVATLTDHTKHLERIENILWDGERVNELERRVVKLAEIVGAADLASPLRRPTGT